jgi:hypothetical protein
MTVPEITALPTPPSRSDSPDLFSTRGDAFLGALPDFQSETNALANYLEGRAVDSNASAIASAASAANAYAREQAAALQADRATTQATASAGSAAESAAFAVTAGTAANIGAISMNSNTITETLTIPPNFNAMSVGKMVIADGKKVTISDNSRWSIV